MGYIKEIRALIGTRPLITVGACVLLLDKERRTLLGRRADSGLWGLIGGGMEPGETLEETARREAREEAGVMVGALTLLGVFSGPAHYHRYPHGDEIYHVAVAYIATDFHGDLTAGDDETTEFEWFSLSQPPPDLNPPDKPILDALAACLAKKEL